MLSLFDDGISLLGGGATINCTGTNTAGGTPVIMPVALSQSFCTAITLSSGSVWRYAKVDTSSSSCTLGSLKAYNVQYFSGSNCNLASKTSSNVGVAVATVCTVQPGGTWLGAAGTVTVSVYGSMSLCSTGNSASAAYALTPGVCGGDPNSGYVVATAVAPYPPASLLTSMCASTPPSLAPSTASLSCYNGLMDVTVSKAGGVVLSQAHYPWPTGIYGSTAFTGTSGGTGTLYTTLPAPPFTQDSGTASVACVAATVTLLGVQRRVYAGLTSADAASALYYLSLSTKGGATGNFTSMVICSTNACNSPATDPCPLPTRDSYSTGACAAQPSSSH